MKKHIINCLCLGLLMCLSSAAFGQIPIPVPDASFEMPFANNATGNCPAFTNCSNGQNCTPPAQPYAWKASHGSPAVATTSSGSSAGPAQDGSQYLSMWDVWDEGEGAFVDFNFNQGQKYLICLWYRLHSYTERDNFNSPAYNNFDARFMIKMANGMTENPNLTACGAAIPNPPSWFTISNIEYQNVPDRSSVSSIDWVQLRLVITPGWNFDQLWFHPEYQGSDPEVQLFLDIDNVNIHAICSDPLTYAVTGVSIPTGPIQAQHLIQVGTEFGAGSSFSVMNDPLEETEMVAGNLIHFKPNTHISVDTGSFTARIQSCDTKMIQFLCTDGPAREGERAPEATVLPKVYPNPLSPNLPLMLEYQSAFEGEVQVNLLDLSGRSRQVHSFYKEAHTAVRQKIPMANLPAGLYIMKITEGQDFKTLKISITN